MTSRLVLARSSFALSVSGVVALIGSLACAHAADVVPSLPTLALTPQPAPSIWSGLYVGSEVFAVSGIGKGSKGGFGGEVNAGYDHEFANNIVLGVQGSTGYTPSLWAHSRVHGFDYASADMKIGYDLGRVMPYVTTGVILAKPNVGSNLGTLGGDSLNNLFNNSASNLQAAGTVGAGVDYALTDHLTVGVAVSVSNGRGFVAP